MLLDKYFVFHNYVRIFFINYNMCACDYTKDTQELFPGRFTRADIVFILDSAISIPEYLTIVSSFSTHYKRLDSNKSKNNVLII